MIEQAMYTTITLVGYVLVAWLLIGLSIDAYRWYRDKDR